MADEWTFVTHQNKNSRRRRNQRNGKKGPTPPCGGSSGLYKATFGNNGPASSIEQHPVIRSRHDDDGPTTTQANNVNDHRVQQLKRDILDCLHALEDQVHSGYGFAHRLITSLATATSFTDEHHDAAGTTTTTTQTSINTQREVKISTVDNNNNAQQLLNLREIVAYGIGNFATDRFQAPMLQLACLLLIRRCASINSQQSTTESDTFEYEQHQVPIYYYEPIMSPAEKNLLTNVFHVNVLDSNEMGKRSVESMRPSVATCDGMQSQSSSNIPNSSATTLFYMPHCPMQLYSNVLWTHWDHILFTPAATKKSPLVIFGNSFQTYDERTISSEKRLDPMNGVFRIIPFAKEDPVSGTPATRDEIIANELRHLEKAFNDCTVISFPVSKEKCKWPDRPMEWIASDKLETNGELM